MNPEFVDEESAIDPPGYPPAPLRDPSIAGLLDGISLKDAFHDLVFWDPEVTRLRDALVDHPLVGFISEGGKPCRWNAVALCCPRGTGLRRFELLCAQPCRIAAGKADRFVVSLSEQERNRLRASVPSSAINHELYALWNLPVAAWKTTQWHQDGALDVILSKFLRLAHIQEEEKRLLVDQHLQITHLDRWNGHLRRTW